MKYPPCGTLQAAPSWLDPAAVLTFPDDVLHQTLPPALPPELPQRFRATVHGTVFAGRADHLDRLEPGDELILLPDPPLDADPGVWVHLPDGDLLGHLPPEIEAWLAPWLLRGGRVMARAVRISGDDVPSWRRLLIEVDCVV